jgi:hypothetical protein
VIGDEFTGACAADGVALGEPGWLKADLEIARLVVVDEHLGLGRFDLEGEAFAVVLEKVGVVGQ